MDLAKLRELLEMELSSNELTSLDEEFYKEFDSLVKALKLRAESSKERGEEIEERLYLAEMNVAEKLIKEILRIRLHKIVDMVFEGRPHNLVGEERKIFSILLAFVNREHIPMEDIEIVEEEVEEKIPESGKQIWEAYLILEDIPKVMDERLREYGPFKAGDLVTLPRTLGHVLVQREAARRVSISH
ncbi:Gins 15 protein [Thermococcus litoralis DSM 5473]|uniref:Gins 15 protein n=1 Tax=Thermococcus litoralis (strain ATCC 51850 / DSM 5473 / JCM 8560 / NS-C) TaxID=523849 RepID=H3ZPL8_THELN|nr:MULTISPECIES: hypothetical protein [Thermococcus]EHR78062.1 Gins 15 protein [Thermococcus litoralis DSM 5473]MCO6042030.1 hypothetical protein [Thermococcus alcaliphilus]